MKADGVFISIGRGVCVDEDALVGVLQRKAIKGAALDVFKVEPLPAESALWKCAADGNLIITAHNADNTPSYFQDGWNVYLDNLSIFQKNVPNTKLPTEVQDIYAGY